MDEARAKAEKTRKVSGGRDEAFIRKLKAEQARERGEEVPEEVEDTPPPPVVREGLAWIWQAYSTLGRSRGYGEGGPQAIRPSDVVAYCALYGIADPETREELATLVEAMDSHFIQRRYREIAEDHERMEEERKREAEKAERRRR